jgi:hypothetical protein
MKYKGFWQYPVNEEMLRAVYNDPAAITDMKATTVFKKKFKMIFTKAALAAARRKLNIKAPYLVKAK